MTGPQQQIPEPETWFLAIPPEIWLGFGATILAALIGVLVPLIRRKMK